MDLPDNAWTKTKVFSILGGDADSLGAFWEDVVRYVKIFGMQMRPNYEHRFVPGPKDKRTMESLEKKLSKVKVDLAGLGSFRHEQLLSAYQFKISMQEPDPYLEFENPALELKRDLDALDRLSWCLGFGAQIPAKKGRRESAQAVLLLARVGQRAIQHGVLKKLGKRPGSKFYKLSLLVLEMGEYYVQDFEDILSRALERVYEIPD